MAITGVNQLIPVTLVDLGTITVADGQDGVTMQFDGIIWRVSSNVGVNGTTSGNTDFVIERTPAGGSAGDLWTIGAGIGRIAHDSDELYLEWDWENSGWEGYSATQIYPPTGTRLKKGDLLELNVNAIPGGSDSADLKVTLWVYPLAD